MNSWKSLNSGASLYVAIAFVVLVMALTACAGESQVEDDEADGLARSFAAGTVAPGRPPTPQVYPWETHEQADQSETTPSPDQTEPSEGETDEHSTVETESSDDESSAIEVVVDGTVFMQHTVAFGESLSLIAQQYNIPVEILAEINEIADDDFLDAGQSLLIPEEADSIGPDFLVIPDSELVFGPGAKDFSVAAVASDLGGYLTEYEEVVELWSLTGPEIVQLVADRYSVNPRLLLALLEHQSGWLTQSEVKEDEYPIGYRKAGYEGLYKQLAWAAGKLNLGYYGRSEGGQEAIWINEDMLVEYSKEINDGTAGIQQLFAAYPDTSLDQWEDETGQFGLFATFSGLFGNPFDYSADPLWPTNIEQPKLSLPWTVGETWYFTGGPHAGWANGSAWAALDFAPPAELFGCVESDSWVTAMADGRVTRSDAGAVVVDLDDDDYAGTGWAILYMHLESRDRISVGSEVKTGDPLGHPSCEGGYSRGTHVHIARTFNGRWVSTDTEIPFIMSGWVSEGLGYEYDGLLVRNGESKEACECREDLNSITAD